MKKILLACFTLFVFISNAQVFDITSFGAVGDGSTLNTAAIQAAVDSCFNAGGGIVRVPPGNFVTATVFLKSNITFLIDSGATITGAPNTSDYPDVIPLIRSYADNYTKHSVFYAEGQSNISIVGPGTFNGNGLSLDFALNSSKKPFGFRFISCTNIRYENLKMRNSGFWMMHNQDIDTLVIKHLDIVNQNFGNGDGIDIDDCSNVTVDSCTADCNDDPIVIKTTALIPSRNIAVSHCTVGTYSRGIKIGTETEGAFENIHISDITVQFSTQGPYGSLYPAKCGINLSVVDGGSMNNVLVENVTMDGIQTPLMIRLGNRANKYTDTAAAPGVGFLRNVELRNITANASTNLTSSVTGIPNYYASDIRLNNIDITFPGGWSDVAPNFTVPENISASPEADIFGDTLPAAGLFIRHVDSIQLHNVCFYPEHPDGRKTIVADDVLNLDSSQVCLSTDVKNVNADKEIILYPNPAGEKLYVENPFVNSKSQSEILNGSGEIVFHSSLENSHAEIDVRNFAQGIYLLKIYSSEEVVVKKFLKM